MRLNLMRVKVSEEIARKFPPKHEQILRGRDKTPK